MRESKGLLLRQVAAELEIDTALLSKVERSDRNLKRKQVQKVAALYDVPEKDMLILWLSEKVNDLLIDEPFALDVLNRSLKELKRR